MTKIQQPNKTLFPKLKILLLASFLFGLLALNLNTTHAQSKSFVWDQYDVVITLQPNGEMHVEETQTLNFVGEPFTFGYATIPVGSAGNNDGIRDLTVREGDFIYSQDNSGYPGTYSTSREGNDIRIDWYFEPALGKRTYTFSYIVDGGVIVGTSEQGDGDQIFWKAIPADHPAYVNNSTVKIILPEGVTPQQYTNTTDHLVAGYANGDDSTVTTNVSENGRILTYQLTQPLPPDQAFEVRVQFPHGILNIPVPAWQTNIQQQDTISLAGYALSLFCLIFGLLLVIFLWYSKGRDPETGIVVPEYITHPPNNLRPAVVGTLTDERADMRDVVSIIIDLAQRGYLTITETEKKEHVFQLTKKDRGHLRPFETYLISSLFLGATKRNLKDVKYKFHKRLSNLRKHLYQELIHEKLVKRSPDTIRNRYAAIGIFMILFVATGFFFGIALVDEALVGALIICPAIAVGIIAIAFIIASRHMPRKTEKGTEAALKWLAFKTYLQNIEQYEDLAQTTDIFEKYLPYATAFGLDRSWIYKFAKQATPSPTWYVPMRPIYSGSTKGTANPASGGTMPTLEGMSDGMTGGLENMSSSLTRMLNSTATTLASTPPSSSSSSGGSSSGFSGGSSFTSGGGGSRGFG